MVQAIAPEAGPEPDQSVVEAAEAKHVSLAGELGLPLGHEVFSLWRLIDPLGSGAFSKVWPSTHPPPLLSPDRPSALSP